MFSFKIKNILHMFVKSFKYLKFVVVLFAQLNIFRVDQDASLNTRNSYVKQKYLKLGKKND